MKEVCGLIKVRSFSIGKRANRTRYCVHAGNLYKLKGRWASVENMLLVDEVQDHKLFMLAVNAGWIPKKLKAKKVKKSNVKQ